MKIINACPRGVKIVLGVLTLASTAAHSQNLSALSDYSVIVSGNLTTTSDIEGRALVGGNLIGTNSATFAKNLQGSVPSSDLTLRVAGNIQMQNGMNLNAGSIELGGTYSGSKVNYNGGGSLVSNPGVDYTSIINGLVLASDTLSGYTPNSNVTYNTSQPGPYKFIAAPDDNGLAIFTVDGNTLFNNSKVQQIELVANGATDVLINVTGSNINWQHGNMVDLFTQNSWRESIIWNFNEAQTIRFDRGMNGQILAPNATVTTNHNIDGSIFAKNLNTKGEVHLPGYGGGIQPVPEPSSVLLLGAAGLICLFHRRRA
jgi:choice-of-anchor A domain-containing protein